MRRWGSLALVAALAAAACGGSDTDSGGETDVAFGQTDGTLADTAETDAPAEPDEPDASDGSEPADTEADVAESDAPVETEAPADTGAGADGPAADGVLAVPDEYDTIQAAVDAASSGDLVLVSPGTYNEAVDVTTDEIVIRGLEREGVVLDGQFELDNGVRVLGATGVAVENLTTQNYTTNGVFFVSSTGYRVSYVSAYRNGDYGIYAFDSVQGQIEHSYGAGSPDAGFYIGQCFPCDANVVDVLSEHNGLGYSGTNAGGNLVIANSTFRNNRAGIVPNSGSYELCYPQRDNLIVGNTVHSNNQPDTPAIDVALLAMGNGILAPGGIANTIERNLVYDHARTGIGLVPFLEEGPNDDLPDQSEWTSTCAEQREQPLAAEIPDTLLWNAYDNVVRGNVILDSGEADLGVAGVEAPTGSLRNCWVGNDSSTSRPADLQSIAPCDGAAADADGGAWDVDPLDVFAWLAAVDSQPPAVDYQVAELPPLPDLEDMPDAATAPARPATDVPFPLDTDAITVPEMP